METDDSIEAAESNEAAAPNPWPARLKRVAHYAGQAFAPALSVVALTLALLSFNRHSEPAPVHGEAARMNSLAAELAATRADLDVAEVALARERSMREEDGKEAEARDAKLIQAISELQVRLKIAPTLQEQMRSGSPTPSSAISAAPSVSAAASAPTSAMPPAHADAAKTGTAAPPPAATRGAAPATAKKPTTSSKTEQRGKRTPQVQSLKDAIERMNKSK